MISQTPQLVSRTYRRDGVWYTLAVIDRTNAVERLATEQEIADSASVVLPEVPSVAASVEQAVTETSAALREAGDQPKPRKKPGRPRKEG